MYFAANVVQFVRQGQKLTFKKVHHACLQGIFGTDNAQTVELASHKYAHAIASRLPVRAVVFGHSHTPEVRALPEAATYVNTGSWTHEGEAGLTYFQLTAAPGGSQGTLRRWAGA